jgi:hypothetical protein
VTLHQGDLLHWLSTFTVQRESRLAESDPNASHYLYPVPKACGLSDRAMDSSSIAPTETSVAGKLCGLCTRINLEALRSSLGYVHQPTYGLLLQSSLNCVLCELIAKSVARALKRNHKFGHTVSEDDGPVRLVCAGRSLSDQQGIRRCPNGPVEEPLLLGEVAVLIGESLDKTRGFSFMGAQLVMVAAIIEYYTCASHS